MTMTSTQNVWKWVSGMLGSILVTGTLSYAIFGMGANTRIAVLEDDRIRVDKVIVELKVNGEKLTAILTELRIQNAAMDVRLKAVETRK